MAQQGVVYVAVAAAAICAGALGFSVIWSYEPSEAPPAQPQIAAPSAREPVPPVAADSRPAPIVTATPGADARSEAAAPRPPAS